MTSIKKIIPVIKLPLLVLVVLNIILIALQYALYLQSIIVYTPGWTPLITSIYLISLCGWFALIWVGFAAAKSLKSGALIGGFAGLIVGLIVGIIFGIISIIAINPLLLKVMLNSYSVLGSFEPNMAFVLGLMPISVPIINGVIFGFIGGFIAKKISK